MLDSLGLTPVCLNYFTDFHQAWVPGEIGEFVREWTRKIEQLNEVGIPMMAMSSGARNGRSGQQEQLNNAVKAYDRVGKVGEKHGVKMLLEVPHLYGIMPRPEQVYGVFEHLDSSNVGALADCSHWGIIGYDVDEFFARLGKRFWHVHLRDSTGPDTADRKQRLEITPGDGVVDFKKFGQALDKANYRGGVFIEFEYRNMTLDAIEREYDRGLYHLAKVGWRLHARGKFMAVHVDGESRGVLAGWPNAAWTAPTPSRRTRCSH